MQHAEGTRQTLLSRFFSVVERRELTPNLADEKFGWKTGIFGPKSLLLAPLCIILWQNILQFSIKGGGGYPPIPLIKPKHRESIRTENIIISIPVYTVLSPINSPHNLRIQGEGGAWYPQKWLRLLWTAPNPKFGQKCDQHFFGHFRQKAD